MHLFMRSHWHFAIIKLLRQDIATQISSMSIRHRITNPLKKKANKGFRGYPVATVAYYGPDDKIASKVSVGIILEEGSEPAYMERWRLEQGDVRIDRAINKQIMESIGKYPIRSVVITDRIIGCPHEEGIDYPEGDSCPKCPYWALRDRWTGEVIR
jgi:hypothetical protein